MSLSHFQHPFDVVRHPQVKRAILASWASDACVVEGAPALRRPPELGCAIALDDVMDALRNLDQGGR